MVLRIRSQQHNKDHNIDLRVSITDTVAQTKEKYGTIITVDPNQIVLTHGGSEMRDGTSLRDYNISFLDTVFASY
jgi:hypothetical protein